MLLSVEHPELLSHLKTLAYGLVPLFHRGDKRYLLAIKASKEIILTARMNSEFKIYLLGDGAGPDSHLGLITAFFDDPDAPLVIRSPQFTGDKLLENLVGLLSQPDFDVYFFDEHDRELMGVRARNPDAARFRHEFGQASFATYAQADHPAILGRLDHRFSKRNAEDDAAAYTITLGERLYTDDFVFIDGRDEFYRFRGADQHVAVTTLEREEPGAFQERDIAVMLGRIFAAECIFLNPIRDDTGKELTDVLVVTDDIMLFIQAKDSPNTAAALKRNLDRKHAAIRAHIRKAVKQLHGALSFTARTGGVAIRTGDGPTTLTVGDRQLWGMVVVREMFDDDYPACSTPVLDMVRSLGLPSVLIDYAGLHIMAIAPRTPASFVNGLGRMLELALEREQFPKPVRYGPPPAAAGE